jgi:hypothetical protein
VKETLLYSPNYPEENRSDAELTEEQREIYKGIY